MVERESSQKDPISILVVDDDGAIVETVKGVLAPAGYEIFGTTNALEALDWAMDHLFHLSILDVHMPAMSGFEVFEKMSSLQIVPCIFMTADTSKELRLKAMDLGAFTVLYKPFSPEVLKYTVQRAVHQNLEKQQ